MRAGGGGPHGAVGEGVGCGGEEAGGVGVDSYVDAGAYDCGWGVGGGCVEGEGEEEGEEEGGEGGHGGVGLGRGRGSGPATGLDGELCGGLVWKEIVTWRKFWSVWLSV